MSTPKVYNKHHKDAPATAVNIMRDTMWGNPFIIGPTMSRDDVVDAYENKIKDHPDREKIIATIREHLKGKDLLCCCAPKRCHGDILLRIANSEGDPFVQIKPAAVHELQGNPFDGIKDAIPVAIEDMRSSIRYLENLVKNERPNVPGGDNSVKRWRNKAAKIRLTADWLETKLKEL